MRSSKLFLTASLIVGLCFFAGIGYAAPKGFQKLGLTDPDKNDLI